MAREAGKAVLVEINSETDFVAKDTNFIAFTEAVADAALGAADVEALKSASVGGKTVEELRAELIAKIGENVQVRRMVRIDSDNNVAAYVHGGRIGVLVEVKGGDAELARGLAMHIAAMNPPHVKASRSEKHQSELQSLMRTTYAVFCLKKKKQDQHDTK